ncbi:hypothetical protein TNCV_1620951 [Trichonephila clavipes]|nr:hypothetical protein TNCV_1620951 [Trichonephila clavipes]
MPLIRTGRESLMDSLRMHSAHGLAFTKNAFSGKKYTTIAGASVPLRFFIQAYGPLAAPSPISGGEINVERSCQFHPGLSCVLIGRAKRSEKFVHMVEFEREPRGCSLIGAW